MATSDVIILGTNFKMIKDDGNLFVWRRHEQKSTVGIAWIITRITWRIEFTTFTRRAAIGKSTTSIWCRSSWYSIFRLKNVSVKQHFNTLLWPCFIKNIRRLFFLQITLSIQPKELRERDINSKISRENKVCF